MQDIFERLFNLIKKTGDKVVFYDSSKDAAYVMMRLEDYEKIATNGKAETNLTDYRAADKIEKINQDIALWREEVKNVPEETPLAESEAAKDDKEKEESQFYFEPVE
jgi:hypothetical protein